MQAEYKKDMQHSHMVFKEESKVPEYEMKMLINNKIPGLLKLTIETVDDSRCYNYDISSMQTIAQIYEKIKISNEQLVLLMKGILSSIKNAREYFLKEENLLLNADYIYVNLPSYQVSVCYLPSYNKEPLKQLTGLFEFFMDRINYEEEGAVKLSYAFYQASRSQNCTLHDIEKILLQEKKPVIEEKMEDVTADKTVKPDEVPFDLHKDTDGRGKKRSSFVGGILSIAAGITIVFIAAGNRIFWDSYSGKPDIMKIALFLLLLGAGEFFLLNFFLNGEKKEVLIKYAESGRKTGEGQKTKRKEQEGINRGFSEKETVYEEKTMVLAKQDESTLNQYGLFAIDREKYQDIPLIEFPFFIGKLKRSVDFVIPSQTVSRFHAKLEREGNKFYLVDLNSTNGTYLNGERLQLNEKREIFFEDKIGFAEVLYMFNKF